MTEHRRTTVDPVLSHALDLLDGVDDYLCDVDAERSDDLEVVRAREELAAAVALIRLKATSTTTVVRREDPKP